MTKQEFENSTFEELMEKLTSTYEDFTTYEEMKAHIANAVIVEDFGLAAHLLEALQYNKAEWYEYDYIFGIGQTPRALTEKEHLKDWID